MLVNRKVTKKATSPADPADGITYQPEKEQHAKDIEAETI